MKPLVSILIPAYNAQKWIADTIQSALSQTWPNKEIIIVDDGSKDQTLVVARRFASGKVSVISQRNQGAAAARNKAFSLCRGDYIQWLDADDLLSPDKIEKQMAEADRCQNKRVLISCPWGHFMYRVPRAKFKPTPLWENLTPLEWLLRKWEHNVFMQTGSWLVSRELTEAAGPWNSQLLSDDDGEYFFRVIMQSREVRFVPEAKVYWRITTSGRLSYIGHSDRKLQAEWSGMQLQVRYLLSMEDNERIRVACLTFLQRWAAYFYPNRNDLFEQTQLLAAELGGWLKTPHLRWKYAWLGSIAGYNFAKRVQFLMPQIKETLACWWDRVMFQLENHKSSALTPGSGKDYAKS